MAISIICITLLVSFTTASIATSPAFFIFGDSTVDAGNNNFIDTTLKANHPPYGQNGFFVEPTGRFSDGRVLVDFIAEHAKLPIIPPFLQPSANFSHGANFASAGAGVLPHTNAGQVIDLQTQLQGFKEVKNWLIRELGDIRAKQLISEAVYYISIGSNDYLGGYIANQIMRETYPPEEYVEMVISNLTRTIQELHELGARKFGFQSLCPLGCIPLFRAGNPKGDGSCFEDLSSLALAHNKALSSVLVILEYLHKGFKYANSDVYSWLDDRIHHPSKHGFKDGLNACCGSGPYGGDLSCGVKAYKVCEAPEEHVWWDSLHPSEKTQEQLAKTMWGDLPPLVGPYNLEGLFFGRENAKIEDTEDSEHDFVEGFGLEP